MTQEGSLTLERGLALLQAVADAGEEATTISDLAGTIGASRAAVYRLLVPLTERGLVRRDDTKVRLGVGLLRLTSQVVPQLRQAGQPILRKLAEETGSTTYLSLMDGAELRIIAVAEPMGLDFHVVCRVGTKLPVATSVAAQVLSLRQSERGWLSDAGAKTGPFQVAAPVRGIPVLRASMTVISLKPLDGQIVGPQVLESARELAAALT